MSLGPSPAGALLPRISRSSPVPSFIWERPKSNSRQIYQGKVNFVLFIPSDNPLRPHTSTSFSLFSAPSSNRGLYKRKQQGTRVVAIPNSPKYKLTSPIQNRTRPRKCQSQRPSPPSSASKAPSSSQAWQRPPAHPSQPQSPTPVASVSSAVWATPRTK